MTERFRFFDSIDGEDEREYTADEFAEYFRQFIRNGIFSGGENLKVETDEQDMKTYIKPGYAWLEGYLYKIDTEPLVMEHKIADPSLNRIDRVVIRLDKKLENRYVKAFILEGAPAVIPEVPALTRNNNVYEISLAQVEVIAGKSFIEAHQITDERLNNNVCGITTHLFEQVDTTDILNEWQNYLSFKKNESNISYVDFVAELQSKLNDFQETWDDWTEAKISDPSGEFYAEWKAWFNELQDTTNLVTKSQFDEHKDNENNPHKVTKAQVDLGNVDNVKQIPLAEKGTVDGVAPLDDEGEVPSVHLGNLPYVDEYYSRVPSLFDFASINNLYHYNVANQVEINLVYAKAFNEVQTSSPSYNGVSYSGGMLRLSAWGSPGITYAIAATEKIDLTNFHTLEVTWKNTDWSDYPNNEVYFGISSGNLTSYSIYDTRLLRKGRFALRTDTINISSYSGEYYLKAAAVDTNTSDQNHITLDIHSVVLKSDTQEFVYDVNNNCLVLKSPKLNGTLKLPQIEMAPNGLSWHNLNLVSTTPAGSSIKVDLYDSNEKLLKSDLESGVRFKRFAESVLKPRVKFARDSTSINPSLKWIAFNQITSGNSMWDYLGTVNVTNSTLSIEVSNLPSYDEYLITGVVLYVSQTNYTGFSFTPYINGSTVNDIEFVTSILRASSFYSGTSNNNQTSATFAAIAQNNRFELIITKAENMGWFMKYSDVKGQYQSFAGARTNRMGNLTKFAIGTDTRSYFNIGTKFEIYGRNFK